MLLSRAADALYWISRYLERAEHTVRLIDVRLDLGLDRRRDSDEWEFDRLYASLQTSAGPNAPRDPTALLDAAFDLTDHNSVASCITSARDNARQVREEISSDMWEQLNGLFLRLKEARADAAASRPHYLSRLVIEGVHLFQGVTDATMGHGEGWQYLQVGRFLERANATAALLSQHFGDQSQQASGLEQSDHGEWVGLLRSCSALEAYSRCYTADLRPGRIAEFLLLNPEFPRSMRFAASRIEAALRALTHLTARGEGGRAERLAGRLHASLGYAQVDEILADGPQAYLEGIRRACVQIHAALYQTYITYPIESALPA